MSSNDSKKPAVPKFGSFKPKPATSNTPSSVPSKTSTGTQNDERKDRHRHRHEPLGNDRKHSRSHSHRHDRRRSRSKDRNETRTVPQIEVSQIGENNKEPLFTFDKRGDPLIVRFGSNDRSRIPAYRRSGAGRILGAPGRITIIRDGFKEVFSLGGNREGASAFRDRSYLAKVLRTKPRRFKQARYVEDAETLSSDEEFVPLRPSRKRKRGDGEPSASSEDEGPSYRSIYGKKKDHQQSDSDLEDSSVTSSQGEDDLDSQDPIKIKFIELSRNVKDHPEDTQSWLDLAQAQESLLRLGEEADVQSKDGAKGLANVKLSLYEEALPHAKSDKDRERILLCLMREGSKVWHPKTLAKRWSEVTQANERSFSLWKGRLNFELTNIATFTYDDLKAFHLERLHRLRDQLPKLSTDFDGDTLRLCDELLYVFLRTTRFVFDAGFTELAVAAWQAMLELTFARPPNMHISTSEESMESFKDFWESEVPRVGEDNAKGWQRFANAEEMADLPEPHIEEPPRLPDTRDAYKAWAAIEEAQTRNGRMPERTLNDGSEDDPYRVVMYSDIEPLLFFIPSPPASAKAALLDAFLLFCGMPPLDLGGRMKASFDDPFVFRGGKAIEKELVRQAAGIGQEPENLSKQPPPFSRDGGHMSITPDLLFSGPHWFEYLVNWTKIYASHVEPVRYDWVAKSMKQVAHTLGFAQAAEYSLALSWTIDHSSSKKTAKSLLKKYPSSIRLYNAYALSEWENGNTELAQNVFMSAASLEATEQHEKQLLWNTWAWKELESNQRQQSVTCLVLSIEDAQNAAASQNKFSISTPSAQVLRARQKLQARRDYLLSSGGIGPSSIFAEALALLEYLTAEGGAESMSENQGNISAAMASILAFSGDLVSRQFRDHAAHEQLLQFGAKLLYFHANHGPYRPRYLREQLLHFITLFPKNTIFLSLFAWAESSLRIDDPVREVLRHTVLVDSQDCLSSRMFAIAHENHAGNVHSTRAAFESALESETCTGSVSLWISYIRFCYSKIELRHKAQDVFYRAIGSCPWSKDLAMEAFTTLVKVMESSELRAIFSTMTSKGLRIHVDLDEFTAKRSQSQRSSQLRAR